MKTTEKKQVGRPVEKEGRKKIGLSIDARASEILNELANRTGKTKSRIFEEAMDVMKKREDIIYARMKSYEKNSLDTLDLDELIKNKEASEKEEVQDVG